LERVREPAKNTASARIKLRFSCRREAVADDDHANPGDRIVTRLALIAARLIATVPAIASVVPAAGGAQPHPASPRGGGGYSQPNTNRPGG